VNHQVLVAAVVTRDNVRAALERLHALGVSPYVAKIFPTVAEARKWIQESGFTSGRYSVA
jgi:D-serine dehydratase